MGSNLSEETVQEQPRDFEASNPVSAEMQQYENEKARLNELIHRLLIVGLIISTSLMLIGLGLDLFLHRATPKNTLGLIEALQQAADMNPSGFLTLGILVLIATPILRVIGSVLAFIYERDRRYAFITFMVFTIVMVSIMSGKS